MTSGNPGLRYERLLFWSAPITVAALLVFLVAAAFDTQEERVVARCHMATANLMADELESLKEIWAQIKADKESISTYKSKIHNLLIFETNGCYSVLGDKLDSKLNLSPEETVSKLREDAKKVYDSPLEFYGVEIPDKATISFFGTKINIGLMSFVQTLQFALTPILLLWLGSLYHTRYREVLLINSAEDLISVFPHVINVFPVGHFPELKRKNFLAFHLPKIVGFFFLIVRFSLLAIFVAPSIIFYIFSLYFLPIANFFISYILGFFVFSAGFCIFAIETLVFGKVFSGPYKLR